MDSLTQSSVHRIKSRVRWGEVRRLRVSLWLLDVNWLLLGCQQAVHGSRHSLHVNLFRDKTEDMNIKPYCHLRIAQDVEDTQKSSTIPLLIHLECWEADWTQSHVFMCNMLDSLTSPTALDRMCTIFSWGVATTLWPLISMMRWPTRTPPRSAIPPLIRLQI